MHDLLKDEHDAVFQHGLKLAEEIQEQTDELGRRRRPEAPDGQTRVGMRRRPTRQSRGHLPPGRGLPREDEGVTRPGALRSGSVDVSGVQPAPDKLGSILLPGNILLHQRRISQHMTG